MVEIIYQIDEIILREEEIPTWPLIKVKILHKIVASVA
ncbi:hypothetical protein SAMN04488577_3397 [Bacillus sp. cl95]|nr:hypothetical protein SAMN02799634_104116 [Bacillus sp. UNCCL13]SFQ89005.1 hypothetical protein SAMN04488577_3397 [Bacillus sp. cl95]